MKKTTIATAEKRVIKAEIKTHKFALRQVTSDCKKERTRLSLLINRATRSLVSLGKSETRESAAILKRLAILEGRL